MKNTVKNIGTIEGQTVPVEADKQSNRSRMEKKETKIFHENCQYYFSHKNGHVLEINLKER